MYQSEDDESALRVASKVKGDFCRIYIFPGGGLSTFNLEPKPIEEMDKYVDRLTAYLIHLKELNQDLQFEKASFVAELNDAERIIARLREALVRKDKLKKEDIDRLVYETNAS